MSRWVAPNFIIPYGASEPDQYSGESRAKPHDDFVVSRTHRGRIVSKYKDDVWDFSAYDPMARTTKILFKYWNRGSITKTRKDLLEEIKLIFFGLMWLRNGPPLAIGTSRNYLSVLKAMARYCEENSCTIRVLLKDESTLWDFIENQKSGWLIETLGSLLTQLVTVNLEFSIVGQKFRSAVRARGQQYRSTVSQHPPIPTRIYSIIIQQLDDLLEDWLAVEDEMLDLIQKCVCDHQVGRVASTQRHIAQRHDFDFQECPDFLQIATPGCLAYIEKRKQKPSVKALSALISEIFLASKLNIQLFTGMRDSEAFSLPFHCLKKHVIGGMEHYILEGVTTKLNAGLPQEAKWVTSLGGSKAVRVVQRLSKLIYKIFRMDTDSEDFKKNDYPLFLGLQHIGLNSDAVMPHEDKFSVNNIGFQRAKYLREQLEPLIEEADIEELEMIDPHRTWRTEPEFAVGQKWKFTSHQLRRSLALYAQRSGLVTLPSLRRQLKHITNEMSLYYSRGSIYAKDFINSDESHMGQLWQDTQPESAGLSYIKNVLMSKEILYGGHASWIMSKLQQPDGTILFDREKTLQSFKRGEIFYKETLIGGCTNRESCSQPALKWINTECLSGGCKNLVCSMSKLEKVILAQQKIVGTLDPDSLEFRSEQADLDVLISAKEKALSMNQQKV